MEVIDKITQKYGPSAIFKLGENKTIAISVIPSGSLKLDEALGVGGYPRGRIIEIYGPESSGKTTLCQHAIAQAQNLGGKAAFVDMEHALDPIYAENCGVDIEELFVSQPDNGEEALEIVEMLVRSGDFDLVVVDSVAALVPRAEIEGEMGDSHMGLQARLMSQAMRKLTSAIKLNDCAVIFTNQIRHKIGVMFGSPETTTGGMALRFYASVRLETRRLAQVKNKGDSIASGVKITIKKSKVSPPFKVAETVIRFGEGFDIINEILDYGEQIGFVKKASAWFSLIDENGEVLEKVTGRENTRAKLFINLKLLESMENQVRSYLGLPLRLE